MNCIDQSSQNRPGVQNQRRNSTSSKPTIMLKVVSVPTDNHTNTNCVYANPGNKADVGHRTFIKGYIFNVLEDSSVAYGTIALNSVQRRVVGVSSVTGDIVELPYGGFTLKRKTSIVEMQIELEHISASKKGGTVDVGQVCSFFDKAFSGQFFTVGQQLVLAMEGAVSGGSKYIATVKSMKAVDESGAEASTAEFIKDSSYLIVTAKEKCEIALLNVPDRQLDANQPNIVQKFDLERLGIGGLRAEFAQVFRRAFASRIFPQSVVKRLGIQHVKGVLLFGPPGTGKTLIARKIGEILKTKPPKIVSGPELLDKFVGGTEANVRKLFAEAEAEEASKGERSQLHLIIFDEFDSLCKVRGSTRDSTGVADNVVNQLLSKIDGVNTLNNVLLIGMTNRKDLIDDAILRPGRFEVHVEIGLPDEEGRAEIFRIHTRVMKESGTLSKDVDFAILARETKNFSGAEIAGVVRSAASHALGRHVDFENPAETINPAGVRITMEDFYKALREVTPAFGQAKDECQTAMRNGIINFDFDPQKPEGAPWGTVDEQAKAFISHVASEGSRLQFVSILLHGSVGCGKSALAAFIATSSAFPYVKYITNDSMVTFGELQKANLIRKAFDDAYKSNSSVVVLDDLERLIEYSQLGGRYSNVILQTLLVMIKKQPPPGKRLIVIGTTSMPSLMEELDLSASSSFSASIAVPDVPPKSIPVVAKKFGTRFSSVTEENKVIANLTKGIPMRKLLMILEMASSSSPNSGLNFSEGGGPSEKLITEASFKAAISSTSNADCYAGALFHSEAHFDVNR